MRRDRRDVPRGTIPPEKVERWIDEIIANRGKKRFGKRTRREPNMGILEEYRREST